MITIIEALEEKIPKGKWCNQGGKDKWCEYFETRKAKVAKNGAIQSHYCTMLDEHINKKECGINDNQRTST